VPAASDAASGAASAAGRVATVADVVGAVDRLYDPGWAEDWDAVGLVCGDPAAPVRRVLLAVDPVAAVAAEAVERGVDLLLTHHPLFLRAVHGVPATTAKGRLAHRLIRAGVALHTAHTNADVADPGVSDALAAALGLTEVRPLAPRPAAPMDKLVTFVPPADADRVLDALAAAGAGRIGDYSRCAWTAAGEGTFRPEPGAHPTIGEVGAVERVGETRLETVLPRTARAAVVAALLAAHPYEKPAYDVIELAAAPSRRGLGRVGRLTASVTAAELVRRAAAALPATAGGLRLAGDPDRLVEVVAVCGGAGDGLLEAAARSGADAYLTADLRHHPASEHVEEGGPALIDAAHWATEWPWLAHAAEQVRRALAEEGTTVEVAVSRQCTDPWRYATGGLGTEPGPGAGAGAAEGTGEGEGTGTMRAPTGGDVR
jgi:dinuclear metal center YbgI/SA1388 family protein